MRDNFYKLVSFFSNCPIGLISFILLWFKKNYSSFNCYNYYRVWHSNFKFSIFYPNLLQASYRFKVPNYYRFLSPYAKLFINIVLSLKSLAYRPNVNEFKLVIYYNVSPNNSIFCSFFPNDSSKNNSNVFKFLSYFRDLLRYFMLFRFCPKFSN